MLQAFNHRNHKRGPKQIIRIIRLIILNRRLISYFKSGIRNFKNVYLYRKKVPLLSTPDFPSSILFNICQSTSHPNSGSSTSFIVIIILFLSPCLFTVLIQFKQYYSCNTPQNYCYDVLPKKPCDASQYCKKYTQNPYGLSLPRQVRHNVLFDCPYYIVRCSLGKPKQTLPLPYYYSAISDYTNGLDSRYPQFYCGFQMQTW